jgi:tetratricopeptide (TPR) repeat protein
VGGLSIVAIAALSPQIANAELRGTLFVLPLLSTDKPLIGTEPGLNRMLRLGQLKMAALDEDADRLDAIFRRFLVEAEGAEGEALQRGMAAYIALSADKARIPPARWFSYLAEIEACDFSSIQSAATLLRAAGDDAIEDYRADDEIEGDELDGVGIDIKDPATALFSLRVGGIRDILELEALFDALSALEPKRRRHYLNSLPEPYLGRRMMTQIAWLRSSEQVGFDGKDAAGRFAAMQARAEAWEDQELAKECLCSRLVLLAEYASDNDGALQLLEEAERRWPSDARLRRERAKIYFRQGRFDEVLQHESELLKDASGSEPVERTHVTREVALSAGESGDLKRAIELFAQAEMIAGESASLSDMRVGLAADRAFCIWRDGRRHEALAEVQDALLAVESLNQTTKRGEYLVRAISIVIRAMYRDLTSPGWDRDFPSLLGVVSRSPHEWSEAPAPTVLSGWYQLESVERSLGADAGVAARLRDRTATSKIVSFEFIKCSVEYLGTIQGGDMAAVVRGLSEFARAGAYARREATLSTDDGLQDDLFDAVEVLPWDGPFNPADDTQRSIVIGAISAAAGFALARGETDWFVRLREASVTEPQLAAFLKMLLGAGNFHPRGPLPISRFWALEAIRKTALAPDDLILVSVRLWEWLGDTVLSRELAEVICPMIAQHWRRVAVEARFALRTPGTTAPAILAATEEVTDRVGLGRLILVAFSGLSVRPAPELLASLREQTEDSHVTSDALSKHVYRRTGGQQP